MLQEELSPELQITSNCTLERSSSPSRFFLPPDAKRGEKLSEETFG